ncbi:MULTISPECIES: head-tail connector protein [Staphylococcus]|uniref:Head-tail connector protein n=1 Tax=Staphylococcus equorum TaxID=246432 RepID=A0AAW7APF0_9STAP|nr:head-tail connector protein [Staphylococcus equorum]MDK9867040.1 head-tail connector protein [Staphylococcus equorum]MDK9869998.1 head-tail connector protein [Staphylococcus equorum]
MKEDELISVKKWLNIDFDIENELLENLVEAAKSELYLSGVPFYSNKSKEYPLYCQAIKYIVSRDYETRGYVEYERQNKGFNDNTLQSFILKLKDW